MDKKKIVYESVIREKKILPFATQMKLEGIILGKISHTGKNKHCVTSYLCAI